ncbi:hypothetical protein [Lacticaseibacillus sp. GG6-2]
MATATQDAKIKAEYDRLVATLKSSGISDEKLSASDSLIQRCAFMTITLQLLENDIKNQGPVIRFKNGKQDMRIENPSQKSYNTMINRYTAAMDKLFALLPKTPVIMPPDPGHEDDDFDEFVADRGE